MVSVAGGWLFRLACEMLVLGTRDFRLPGLGSYLQTAAGTGNFTAITWGLVTMIAIIVATDQLIWRPVIAWCDKFKFEQVERSEQVRSPLLHLLQHSRALRTLQRHTVRPLSEGVYRRLAARQRRRITQTVAHKGDADPLGSRPVALLRGAVLLLIAAVVLYAALHALTLLRQLRAGQFAEIMKGRPATFLRGNTALLLDSAWTITARVTLGSHPRAASNAQPIA